MASGVPGWVRRDNLRDVRLLILTHIERFLAIGNVKKCAAPNKHKATVILGAC